MQSACIHDYKVVWIFCRAHQCNDPGRQILNIKVKDTLHEEMRLREGHYLSARNKNKLLSMACSKNLHYKLKKLVSCATDVRTNFLHFDK